VYLLKDSEAFGSFGTGACDFTDAQLIGDISGASYNFDVPDTTLYFGCMIGTHCQMGQKLAVTVGAPPPVNCSVTWSGSWTKCSRRGSQSRKYTTNVYAACGGEQCPPMETRNCLYGETHESFPMAQMCQYEPINVTVGDVLVFKRTSLADDVFSLPSQWHYAECNFTDGGELLPPDDSSTPTHFQYTIHEEDIDTRLYLASSRDTACSGGQRVLVSVDDFKQGTLAEAIKLVETRAYEN